MNEINIGDTIKKVDFQVYIIIINEHHKLANVEDIKLILIMHETIIVCVNIFYAIRKLLNALVN